MRRGLRLLLSLVAILLAAQVVAPNKAQTTTRSSVESLLTHADHERDYFSERSTRTAVPTEVSSHIAPPSARTSVWRGRTHASGTSSALRFVAKNHCGRALCSTLDTQTVPFTSRAADYYIYALRHIII